MGRIQRKVYAVAELFDRFTGEPFGNEPVGVMTTPKWQMISKDNGCFVFLEQPQGNGKEEGFIAEFTSRHFKSRKLLIKREEESTYSHYYLWMEPDSTYPYPVRTTCLTGTVQTKGMLLVPKGTVGQNIRLMADYREGSRQMMLHGLPGRIAGLQYILYQNDEPASEVFTLLGKGEDIGSFLLKQPLKREYKKSETRIYPVYPVLEKEDGTFFVALHGIEEYFTCDFIMNHKKMKEYELTAGKWNQLGNIDFS